MIYCYPLFSKIDLLCFRIGGPGLGNLLFPWARAIILAEENGYRNIAPNWTQFKIGPLLRKENDIRSYSQIFKNNPNDLIGFNRLKALINNRRIPENLIGNVDLRAGDIIITEGMGTMFSDILKYHNLIYSKLLSIYKNQQFDNLIMKFDVHNSIAVHIRFGDFKKSKNLNDINTRQPIEWYVDAILAVRKKLNFDIRVNIFSDANDIEIGKVLALPSVFRIVGNNALDDIFLISKHRLLIASGSTFSMWASFLGQVPTIWFPGKKIQNLLEDSNLEVEYEFGKTLLLNI